jgi:hypothetical protein
MRNTLDFVDLAQHTLLEQFTSIKRLRLIAIACGVGRFDAFGFGQLVDGTRIRGGGGQGLITEHMTAGF